MIEARWRVYEDPEHPFSACVTPHLGIEIATSVKMQQHDISANERFLANEVTAMLSRKDRAQLVISNPLRELNVGPPDQC
jgi:hypothetical protein